MSQQSANYPQALEEAFHTFNRLSGQLADSYHALETQVSSLNEELAQAHDQRFKELSEKERLANRLGTLLDALPGGVIVLNKDGEVAEYNPAAADLLGEPLHGIAWQFIIKRSFAPKSDDGHDISLIDGRRVNISTCPLGTEPGQILLITDVTEVRKLQDRLNQHQHLAAMGEMAAALAHQVRTPLSSAILYSSQLKRLQCSDMERQSRSEKIISRLRHLEHIVNDMLLYARGARTGTDLFTIEEMFADIFMSIEGQINPEKTQLDMADKTGNTVLRGNRQMLVSALTNLLVNASQVIEDEGMVFVIATVVDGNNIRLIVQDNGPGFTPDAEKNAFTPFYTTRSDGTGLGLAVVNAIVNSHDGEISLTSRRGRGSTFDIVLPIVETEDINNGMNETVTDKEKQLLSMR
ncbi:MAG: ATP-binding protein [Gammaproteobacteria bacterium]|nr:ATP-binding protein [Gammaproteobacteria bacterium]